MQIFGLSGTSGALTFLAGAATVLIAGWCIVFFYGPRFLAARGPRTLWKIPLLGPCLEAWTLGRLAWVWQMTLDSSLSIARGVKLGFAAVGLEPSGKPVAAALKKGLKLSEALLRCSWLPEDFLAPIAVAEAGGNVPEQLGRMALHYRELTVERVKLAVTMFSFGIWFLYAGLMVALIMAVASVYLGAL